MISVILFKKLELFNGKNSHEKYVEIILKTVIYPNVIKEAQQKIELNFSLNDIHLRKIILMNK